MARISVEVTRMHTCVAMSMVKHDQSGRSTLSNNNTGKVKNCKLTVSQGTNSTALWHKKGDKASDSSAVLKWINGWVDIAHPNS